MEKLELKHLAGDLPYGLETIYNLSDVIGCRKDETRSKLLTAENCDFVFKYCKPILRPLSSLTKEIEVNGEKFVPIEELKKIHNTTASYKEVQEGIIDQLKTDSIPYWIVKKIYEWHFDIHGLIEKDLAIDINTLEQ